MFTLFFIILSVLWLGIGFISTILLERFGSSDEPAHGQFIRFCFIIFWPITMVGFIITGVDKD